MTTALVTGANAGIGLATSLELARRGLDVVGTVRSEDKAASVATAAADAGVELRTTLLDITDADRAKVVIDEVRPDVLVNNAGFAEAGAVEDVDEEEAADQLDLLVLAPMRLARLAVPHMRAAGGGRIISVSSVLARVPSPLLGWYAGAKQALEGVSEALRLEVARDGIDVILVEPGGVKTGVFDDARGDLDDRIRKGTGYESAYRMWSELTKQAQAMMATPEMVARTIADAAESPNPRARYRVGLDARLLEGIERIAPTRVVDTAARLLFRL